MKLERIKGRGKKLATVSFCILFLSFFGGIFQGCEKEVLFENAYSDSEFLDLTPDANITKMSAKDLEILSEATGRLDIYRKNGFYCIKQTTGAQVNISDNLFIFIKSMYENTNNILSKSNSSGYSVPRLKNGDPEEGGTTGSDCLPRSISYAGGGSYGEVGSWTLSNYGSLSVPLSSFYDCCHNFFPDGDTVDIGSIPDGFMNNEIIILMIDDTTAHAVNGQIYDENNGTIYFYDPQNDNSGTLWVDEIIYIYQP